MPEALGKGKVTFKVRSVVTLKMVTSSLMCTQVKVVMCGHWEHASCLVGCCRSECVYKAPPDCAQVTQQADRDIIMALSSKA